jgi:hypothetical protein
LVKNKVIAIANKKNEPHGFCDVASMFLTTPTLEELMQSDLPDLVDMLSKQATAYSQLIKIEGITSKTIAIKDLILNIQTAIDAKKASEQKLVIR